MLLEQSFVKSLFIKKTILEFVPQGPYKFKSIFNKKHSKKLIILSFYWAKCKGLIK